MATTTHVPVKVYLRSSYEPDAEYVDGRIEKRPMGEFDHSSWQQAILRVIDPQDSTFYRYEDLHLRRTNSFSHAEKGFAFNMNELKNLLD